MATKKTLKRPARTPAKSTSGKKAAAPRSKTSSKAAPKKAGARKAAAKKTAPAKPSRAAIAKPAPPPENPQAKALAHTVAQLVLDKKALDVVILDVRGMTSYADYFVFASGESERQVTAMADFIRDELKVKQGLRPLGQEGMETGQWVLLDYGEVVTHLFFQEARGFYDLEGLWADAKREKVA